MEVACSTLCFTREPLERALRHVAELEFSKVDLAVGTGNPHLAPQDILTDLNSVVQRVRQGPTLGFSAITARLASTGDEYLKELDAIAHLAQQLAAPVLVVASAPAGTPLEQEVARLKALEKIASLHGSVLTIATQMDTLSEDPSVAAYLCENVPGLGLTLDPSHYICGPHQGKSFDQVYPFARHAHFRDTGRRRDQFQVQIGRGAVEYGKIVTSMKRFQYAGALTVCIEDAQETKFEVETEVRKLRLLLESLI